MMRKHLFPAICVLLAGSSSLPAQSPFDARVAQLLPADTSFVLGIQWRQFMESEAGKSLRAQIGTAATLSQLPLGAALQDMLLKDVDSVFLAAPANLTAQLAPARPGVKAPTPPILAIVKGRFNLAAIREWAKEKKGATEIYKDVELLRIASVQPSTGRLAVLDGSTMIFGERRDVLGAIDRRRSPAAGAGIARLGARLADMSARHDVFFLAQVPAGTFAAKDTPPAMQIFRDVSAFDMGLTFRAGMVLTANLITRDAETAKSLAATVESLLALAAQGNNNPQTADLVKRLKIAPAGANVNLAMSVSQAEIDALMKQGAGQNVSREPVYSGPPGVSGPDGTTPIAPKAPEPVAPKSIRITGLENGPVEVKVDQPRK